MQENNCNERPCDSVIIGLLIMVFCVMAIFYTWYVKAERMARLYTEPTTAVFLKCDVFEQNDT